MFIHSMGGYGILGGVRRYVSVTSFTRGSELAGGEGGRFDVALGWGGDKIPAPLPLWPPLVHRCRNCSCYGLPVWKVSSVEKRDLATRVN